MRWHDAGLFFAGAQPDQQLRWRALCDRARALYHNHGVL